VRFRVFFQEASRHLSHGARQVGLYFGSHVELNELQVHLIVSPDPAHQTGIGKPPGRLGVAHPFLKCRELGADQHDPIEHDRRNLIENVTAALMHAK
jgi:hypothetical protein